MECPHCHNKIEVPDLWEFFDCTNCGVSLQLENNELKILKTPEDKTSTNQNPSPQEVEESFSDSAHQPPKEAPQSAENSTHQPVSTAEEGDFSETPHADSLPSSENIPQNSDEQSILEANEASPAKNENLSNILDFESPPHQGNHFTYSLNISGISSKALLDKIHHIFRNPRLKIDTSPPMQNNTLTVNNLSAVQMVYILRKLSPLSVRIYWRQKSTLK